MKALPFILFLLLNATSAFGQQSIQGVWNTGRENTKIQISEEDGTWKGKILSSDNSKAPIGKTLLKDLKKKGNTWKGLMFIAKKQDWYDVSIQKENEELELKVSVGFMSKTVTWVREN